MNGEKARDYYPFNHKGLVLADGDVAVLDCRGSHLCGYVALPNDSIPKEWRGNYAADALQYLNIHGGITYCDAHEEDTVFGFDCAHSGDDENPLLKDPEHVKQLVLQMKAQLLAYAAVIDEWRAADRETRIKMVDEIAHSGSYEGAPGMGFMLGLLSGRPEFGEGATQEEATEDK